MMPTNIQQTRSSLTEVLPQKFQHFNHLMLIAGRTSNSNNDGINPVFVVYLPVNFEECKTKYSTIMKKMITVSVAFVLMFTVFTIKPVQAQNPQMPADTLKSQIPADVMKIIEKSCNTCHSEPGNKMAMMKLRFSKWDEYTSEKKAEKAKAMCNMLTKGKMPPKKFVAKNPDTALSPEEMKRVCEWAGSFQTEK